MKDKAGGKHADAKAAGHERREVRSGLLALMVLSLFVGVALLMLITAEWQAGIDAPAGRSPEASRRLFPAPRLESDFRKTHAAYRENQRQQLASYGWIDRAAGRVRLPIERAMALVLEEGLPEASERVTRLDMLQRQAEGGRTP